MSRLFNMSHVLEMRFRLNLKLKQAEAEEEWWEGGRKGREWNLAKIEQTQHMKETEYCTSISLNFFSDKASKINHLAFQHAVYQICSCWELQLQRWKRAKTVHKYAFQNKDRIHMRLTIKNIRQWRQYSIFMNTGGAELPRELQRSRKKYRTLLGAQRWTQKLKLTRDLAEPRKDTLDTFEHGTHTWQARVSCREGAHDFAIVGLDESSKCWDSTRDTCLWDQREEPNHCQTTILHLAKKFRGLFFFWQICGESKGIKEWQGQKWVCDSKGVESRELARFASTHVMHHAISFKSCGPFGPEFKKSDDQGETEVGLRGMGRING